MARWLLPILLCAIALVFLPSLAEPLPPTEVGEVDLMAPEIRPEGEATPTPTATPSPTPAPTATPIPYYSSLRYPEGKVTFEDEIWSILTQNWGLSDFQAAGLMGCIQAESSFSPYDAERVGTDARGVYAFRADDGVGFGLCQWTSAGRKASLERYAASWGDASLVWDFNVQMAYLRREIDLRALKQAETLYEATEWAVLRYERPNQRYSSAWPGTRYEKGKALYLRHVGAPYAEPAPEFAVTQGQVPLVPVVDEATGETAYAATITASGNYYWRLSQTDPAGDWLEALCERFYHPGEMETCVCGYACEGEKALTLRVADLPPAGETREAALRFEVYWGDHLIKTVPVALTGGENPTLTLSRGRVARGRQAH